MNPASKRPRAETNGQGHDASAPAQSSLTSTAQPSPAAANPPYPPQSAQPPPQSTTAASTSASPAPKRTRGPGRPPVNPPNPNQANPGFHPPPSNPNPPPPPQTQPPMMNPGYMMIPAYDLVQCIDELHGADQNGLYLKPILLQAAQAHPDVAHALRAAYQNYVNYRAFSQRDQARRQDPVQIAAHYKQLELQQRFGAGTQKRQETEQEQLRQMTEQYRQAREREQQERQEQAQKAAQQAQQQAQQAQQAQQQQRQRQQQKRQQEQERSQQLQGNMEFKVIQARPRPQSRPNAARDVDFSPHSQNIWDQINKKYSRLSDSRQYAKAFDVVADIQKRVGTITQQATTNEATFATKFSALDTFREIGETILGAVPDELSHRVRLQFQSERNIQDSMSRIIGTLTPDECRRMCGVRVQGENETFLDKLWTFEGNARGYCVFDGLGGAIEELKTAGEDDEDEEDDDDDDDDDVVEVSGPANTASGSAVGAGW